MTIRRILECSLLVVSVLVASGVTMLTESAFFVARGSDVGADIHTTSTLTKVVTVACVTAAWIASTTNSLRGRRWTRWVLRVLGLVALALSTHLVVFNNRRGMLEEHWFLIRLDRAAYNQAEGLYLDWSARRSKFGVALNARDKSQRRFVFTGIPPWNLDLESSLRSHNL